MPKILKGEGEDDIKITSLYSWWRNPIKWWKQRKVIKLMNLIANQWWRDGGEEEYYQLTEDLLFRGMSLRKNGKRVDLKDFPTP